ncbi:MAG: zf-HC2 domain-containing protein, partial [Pirellulales bacterium]
MNVRNEELLSAYLDGELSGEEQARVEQLLAENGSFRSLHDDLRALRIDVESLPRYAAPEGFAQQVLAEARRQAAKATAVGPAPEQNGKVDLPEQGSIAMSGRSRWVWPLIAAAAALLILLFNPSDEDEVARHDAPPDAAQRRQTDERARSAPSMEAAPSNGATTSESTPAAPPIARDEANDKAKEESKKDHAAASRQHSGEDRFAHSLEGKQEAAATAADGAVEQLNQADSLASRPGAGGGFGEGGVEKQARVAPSAELRSGGLGGGGNVSPQGGPAELAEEGHFPPPSPPADAVEDFDRNQQTLVVSLTVTSETARARLVEQLLAQEGAQVAEQRGFASRRFANRSGESRGESPGDHRGRQSLAPPSDGIAA